MSVIKTRQQSAELAAGSGVFRDFKRILRAEGFRGLYRGFGTVTIAVYAPVSCVIDDSKHPKSDTLHNNSRMGKRTSV